MQGILLNELDLNEIRSLGFTDFRTLGTEMHYDDELRYQEFIITKLEELDANTTKYMQGQDDAKLFIFSDNAEAIMAISRVFNPLPLRPFNIEDWPLDYSYKDNNDM